MTIQPLKSVALVNLGCSRNVVDGEQILQHFERSGYTVAKDPATADIIVVNTCAFIQEAKQEAIDTIIRMAQFKKTGHCQVLVVTGCFAQRYKTQGAKAIPEVDIWAGIKDWPAKFKKRFGTETKTSFHRSLTGTIASQYLKIAEGCLHRCSFCAIPAIRGKFISRPVSEIIAEANWLESQGVKECILVSQDTSCYGRDIDNSLAGLLKTLVSSTDFPWIRLMYLHPDHIDDSLLDIIAREPKLCPYFDIPLQHIDDAILTSMKRRPLSSGIKNLIKRIRTAVPDATIRTSFIIGYPGESDDQFSRLVDFIEETRFDKIGIFPFSPEEGTAAFDLPDRPDAELVRERCEQLMLVAQEISSELLATRVSQTMQVIIDRPSEFAEFAFEGRTQRDAPEVDGHVWIRDPNHKIGDIVSCTITDSGDYDLYV